MTEKQEVRFTNFGQGTNRACSNKSQLFKRNTSNSQQAGERAAVQLPKGKNIAVRVAGW